MRSSLLLTLIICVVPFQCLHIVKFPRQTTTEYNPRTNYQQQIQNFGIFRRPTGRFGTTFKSQKFFQPKYLELDSYYDRNGRLPDPFAEDEFSFNDQILDRTVNQEQFFRRPTGLNQRTSFPSNEQIIDSVMNAVISSIVGESPTSPDFTEEEMFFQDTGTFRRPTSEQQQSLPEPTPLLDPFPHENDNAQLVDFIDNVGNDNSGWSPVYESPSQEQENNETQPTYADEIQTDSGPPPDSVTPAYDEVEPQQSEEEEQPKPNPSLAIGGPLHQFLGFRAQQVGLPIPTVHPFGLEAQRLLQTQEANHLKKFIAQQKNSDQNNSQ